MLSKDYLNIVSYIRENPSLSSKNIYDALDTGVAYATLKRMLSQLMADNLIISSGKGRGTKYLISPAYELFHTIDVNQYFMQEIDEREIKGGFNLELINGLLSQVSLFNEAENKHLMLLQNKYETNTSMLTSAEYSKELERLAIDLSWKSSQIEGNTYSLLETERLLREKETAEGKSKDDATMLLNHKDALDFIIANPGYASPLTVSGIEDIHSLLVKDLGIDRNIRKRKVGISGTNYVPLDNEYQIREALKSMCLLVSQKSNIFEKALLSLLLISYIQAFADGNKRTARIVSNAVLIDHQFCPISFRTINSIDYKKAMLLFYEQNNISAFKDIFIAQFEFAVQTYF
ncbi:MAG: Fic family protein [Kangiellaceae bacterium]